MNVKTLTTELEVLTGQAKNLYAEIEGKGDKATADDRTRLNNMIESAKAKRQSLEQAREIAESEKLIGSNNGQSRGREGGNNSLKSAGQVIVESEQFKSIEGKAHLSNVHLPAVQVKALYETGYTQGGYLVRTERDSTIYRPEQEQIDLLDLIPVEGTNSNLVEYITMSNGTNNAGFVAETTNPAAGASAGLAGGTVSQPQTSPNVVFGLKAESDIGPFALQNAAVLTLAHWVAASRQILSDVPRLRALVDNELRDGCRIKLQRQVLKGAGGATDFMGILSASGLQTNRVMAATGSSGNRQTDADTIADTLRRAVTDLEMDGFNADAIAIAPGWVEALTLQKDGNDNYMNIFDRVTNRVWGVRVISTKQLNSGVTAGVVANDVNAVVGSFRAGAKMWLREDVQIYTGQPGDFFLRNAIAVLAEMRAAFAVVQPKAFEKVFLGRA